MIKKKAPARGSGAISSFTQLVTSLSAIPTGALKQLAVGKELSKKAADELQKAFDNLNAATQALKMQADDEGKGKREGLEGPDPTLMNAQAPLWNALMDYYFRLDINGWEKIPDESSLFIGVHSGGPLTMDAWTVALAWWRHFKEERSLRGTAHDVLMTARGLGTYFRRMGTITPTRENIGAAFAKGDDVILWPGGEVDAFRSWDKRDKAVLGDRKDFIRLAIREGVPITLSIPFGVTLHLTPFQHIPLPAKIRTEFLDPICLDTDADRENDNDYVTEAYEEIKSSIQAGMERLAKKRKFPILG